MEPMTKEEAESFLKWNPKPWSYDHNHEYYKEPTVVCKDKVRIRLKELLRYVAYLEQQNQAMQGLIDIMGEDK